MVLQLGHRDEVIALAYASNGSLFATLAREADTGHSEVKVWDGRSGQLIRTIDSLPLYATSLALSPDGRTLATDGDASPLSLWAVDSGRLLRRLSARHPPAEGPGPIIGIGVASLCYTPDGRTLVTSGGYWEQSGQVCLWDVATGRLFSRLAPHAPDFARDTQPSAAVPGLALSRDGRILAVPTRNAVRIWNLATRRLLCALPTRGADVTAIALTPEGQSVVIATDGGALKVCSTKDGRLQKDLSIKDGSVRSLAISPDGQVLVAGLYGGGGSGLMRQWSLRDGKELSTRQVTSTLVTPVGEEGMEPDVVALAFAPDGKSLAMATGIVRDSRVGVWDIARGNWRQPPLEAVDEVLCLAFSTDGNRLVSSHDDGTLRLWNARAGQLIRTIEGHTGEVNALAISPDGRWMASSSRDDGTTKWWNAGTGQLHHTFKQSATDLAFSPDGSRLLSSHNGKMVRLFATSTFEVLREWEEKEHGATQVAFSPDGKHLAVGGMLLTPRLKSISIRDADSGTLEQELRARSQPVQMEYAPDGRFLIVRDRTETIDVLDVKTGQQKWRALEQSGFALSSAVAGKSSAALFCRGRDGWMQKRDIATGRILRRWQTQSSGVRHDAIVDDYDAWAAASPGGEWLAGRADDGSIKLWGTARGRLHLSLLVTPSAKPIDVTADVSQDWIAYTRDGSYNSSPGAEKFLRWRQGGQMFPASKFQKKFRQDDKTPAPLDHGR